MPTEKIEEVTKVVEETTKATGGLDFGSAIAGALITGATIVAGAVIKKAWDRLKPKKTEEVTIDTEVVEEN